MRDGVVGGRTQKGGRVASEIRWRPVKLWPTPHPPGYRDDGWLCTRDAVTRGKSCCRKWGVGAGAGPSRYAACVLRGGLN